MGVVVTTRGKKDVQVTMYQVTSCLGLGFHLASQYDIVYVTPSEKYVK